MEKRIFRLVVVLLSFVGLKTDTFGHFIPKTHGDNTCGSNCSLAGWHDVDGSWSFYNIGNKNGPNDLEWWVNNDGVQIIQPSSPSGGPASNWLTIKIPPPAANAINGAYTSISGLTVGKTYTLTYNVMTGRSQRYSPIWDEYYTSRYAKNATLWITNGAAVLVKKTASFENGYQNQWIKQTITFVAPASSLKVTLTGEGYNMPGDTPNGLTSETGWICLDIAGTSALKQECDLSSDQVKLVDGANVQPVYCSGDVFNLLTAAKNPPPGTVVRWFSNSQHTGSPLASYWVGAGTYFAFYYDEVADCYNTPHSTAAVTVTAGGQVPLSSTSVTLDCSNLGFNLNSSVTGAIPFGAEVLWFDNPNHTGNPIQGNLPVVVNPGTYYAFYKRDCFGESLSTSAFTVIRNVPDIASASVKNICPLQTANLNSALSEAIPAGHEVRWFTNNTHSGNPVANPQNAPIGSTYYAFYYHLSKDCYTSDLSIAQVQTVSNSSCPPCYAGTSQVSLAQKNVAACPGSTVNLENYVSSQVPAGTLLVWFNNATHTLPKVADPKAVPAGEYYAFVFDAQNNCYNTASSSAKVTVSVSSSAPVVLTASSLQIICPATTASLSKLPQGTPPTGATVAWYSNASHSGQPVADVTKVSAGTYYAFYSYGNGCFNTNNSTASVTVTGGQCNVAVGLKVFLQGAMDLFQPRMRNDLQTYEGYGLLPANDPYNGGASHATINSIQSSGKIVDWVKVEVRDAANPLLVLESKSLILHDDGTITEPNNSLPVFKTQPAAVRLAITHRNHLPVISTILGTEQFKDIVSYDFSVSLYQAYKPEQSLAPNQMILKNGIWCMWAGDLNDPGDLGMDATDYNKAYITNQNQPFGAYIVTDVNMDGAMDSTDMNMMYINNEKQPFSILYDLMNP